MKVLVVDDSAMVRKTMQSILKELGHSVLLASNGKESVEIYKDKRPDLVTMDLTMPIMNGFHALRILRRIDPHAKIIISTSNGFSDLVLSSMKEGASGYILKPITIETLKDAISKATGIMEKKEEKKKERRKEEEEEEEEYNIFKGM